MAEVVIVATLVVVEEELITEPGCKDNPVIFPEIVA